MILGTAIFAVLQFLVAPNAQPSPNLTGDLESQTLQVAKGLYCPVCAGVPLDVCETQACQQWRDLIRQKLSEGQSTSEIQQYFVQQYGERVLGAPRAQGLNIGVYLLPAFAVSAGVALLYLFAVRRLKPTPAVSPAASVSPPAARNEYRSRVEQELKQDD